MCPVFLENCLFCEAKKTIFLILTFIKYTYIFLIDFKCFNFGENNVAHYTHLLKEILFNYIVNYFCILFNVILFFRNINYISVEFSVISI